MYRLIPNLQSGLQAMGLQPNILIEYLQSFFGNVSLQFSLTAISGSVYQIIVVHERIIFHFNFDGKKVDAHTLSLRNLGRIDESFDGSQYFVTIYDSGFRPFYTANTNHIELTKEFRRLVNILLAGMN